MSLLASSTIVLLAETAGLGPILAATQATVGAPLIELGVGSKTPEEVTEPIETLKCKIEWAAGKRSIFTMRKIGRRGYRDATSAEIRSTDEKVEFIDDPDKLFTGYYAWWAVRDGFEAKSSLPGAQFGSRVGLQFERTEFSETRKPLEVRAVTVSSFMDWMPLVKAVGFCDVTYVSQEPLSSTEVAELGKS